MAFKPPTLQRLLNADMLASMGDLSQLKREPHDIEVKAAEDPDTRMYKLFATWKDEHGEYYAAVVDVAAASALLVADKETALGFCKDALRHMTEVIIEWANA